MLKTLLVLALPALALADDAFSVLKRQLVRIPCSESGLKDCGDICIPLTYTCCPGQQGGCPLTSRCWLGNNGQYACCPIGQICDGPGGVNTLPGETVTSTIVFTESVSDEQTSTSFFAETSTATFTLTSEIESTSTGTSLLAEPTTSLPAPPVVPNTPTTTAVLPTIIVNNTSTRPPPVTVNGANTRGGSFLQVIAAGAVALLAL
ncbi:GPI anchored serine-threonine rich protein [Colletotrichum orchidophilum]|uniref:GPI anchored serine-threonine rich protein n=1 Tax=Colletotrichum orchidophilum TaxID=1209926 RepID=A0A1G4ARS2_9PEZI|nr:GPI anchored serine-threonine rich protein [Colletotrichum orchidophilum]OHE91859.1 GPI anchored serine-threonine rich protein [Colletotrichum orchidophilum]